MKEAQEAEVSFRDDFAETFGRAHKALLKAS